MTAEEAIYRVLADIVRCWNCQRKIHISKAWGDHRGGVFCCTKCIEEFYAKRSNA